MALLVPVIKSNYSLYGQVGVPARGYPTTNTNAPSGPARQLGHNSASSGPSKFKDGASKAANGKYPINIFAPHDKELQKRLTNEYYKNYYNYQHHLTSSSSSSSSLLLSAEITGGASLSPPKSHQNFLAHHQQQLLVNGAKIFKTGRILSNLQGLGATAGPARAPLKTNMAGGGGRLTAASVVTPTTVIFNLHPVTLLTSGSATPLPLPSNLSISSINTLSSPYPPQQQHSVVVVGGRRYRSLSERSSRVITPMPIIFENETLGSGPEMLFHPHTAPPVRKTRRRNRGSNKCSKGRDEDDHDGGCTETTSRRRSSTTRKDKTMLPLKSAHKNGGERRSLRQRLLSDPTSSNSSAPRLRGDETTNAAAAIVSGAKKWWLSFLLPSTGDGANTAPELSAAKNPKILPNGSSTSTPNHPCECLACKCPCHRHSLPILEDERDATAVASNIFSSSSKWQQLSKEVKAALFNHSSVSPPSESSTHPPQQQLAPPTLPTPTLKLTSPPPHSHRPTCSIYNNNNVDTHAGSTSATDPSGSPSPSSSLPINIVRAGLESNPSSSSSNLFGEASPSSPSTSSSPPSELDMMNSTTSLSSSPFTPSPPNPPTDIATLGVTRSDLKYAANTVTAEFLAPDTTLRFTPSSQWSQPPPTASEIAMAGRYGFAQLRYNNNNKKSLKRCKKPDRIVAAAGNDAYIHDDSSASLTINLSNVPALSSPKNNIMPTSLCTTGAGPHTTANTNSSNVSTLFFKALSGKLASRNNNNLTASTKRSDSPLQSGSKSSARRRILSVGKLSSPYSMSLECGEAMPQSSSSQESIKTLLSSSSSLSSNTSSTTADKEDEDSSGSASMTNNNDITLTSAATCNGIIVCGIPISAAAATLSTNHIPSSTATEYNHSEHENLANLFVHAFPAERRGGGGGEADDLHRKTTLSSTNSSSASFTTFSSASSTTIFSSASSYQSALGGFELSEHASTPHPSLEDDDDNDSLLVSTRSLPTKGSATITADNEKDCQVNSISNKMKPSILPPIRSPPDTPSSTRPSTLNITTTTTKLLSTKFPFFRRRIRTISN